LKKLDEIKERRAQITEPPWAMETFEADAPNVYFITHRKGCIGNTYYCAPEDYANGQFIASAPSDVDWLTTRVEELEAEAAKYRKALAEAAPFCAYKFPGGVRCKACNSDAPKHQACCPFAALSGDAGGE
jgi:hypothetical protein